MGKKNKNQEDYWASEEFEKDQQLLDEKSPAPAKSEPKKEQKATPVASENEPAKQTQATVLGGTTLGSTQQKKKNNNKKKKANQNQQDEGADAEESQNAEKSQPKKTDAVEKEGKDSTTPAPAEDTKGEKEDEDDGTSGGASAKDKKKKKKGKGTAAATETAPAPSKKSTIGKKLAEALAKQREEEERKQKEEEERLKREQEEEEKRLEEERRQEEIRLAKKEKKKLKEKERLVAKQQKEKEQKIAQMKQQFVNQGVNISIPALESETASTEEQKPQKREKPVYAKKKKFNKNNDDDDKPTQPVQPVQAVEVKEAKEEVADDWETKADSWEDLNADELTPVAEKKEPPKQEVAKPAPKPESALVPAPKPTGGKKKGRGKEVEEPKEKPFRSPICVVLGHVDTGKTKLLDKIRRTNVQEGEAGGITQQIGATYFPMDNLKDQIGGPVLSKVFSINGSSIDIKVPGLLIIDTPGHESFTNLRSRGTSLCDIAILVVDIMHGLEQQTIESINLLKSRKTPFVVALNKIDRIYGWKANPGAAIQDTLAKQDKMVIMEFEKRVKDTITYFAEQSLNAALYYKNPDIRKYVSFVPTSAVTGEGIPDLLLLLVQLTQQMMSHRLTLSDELQCTVLEVKVVEGLGTTIDVILVNGELNEGDTIVICGLNGPIVTTIRALLTPQPMKEIRVKGSYIHHKNIKAAQGVKISAADLDKAIAGSSLCVCGPDDDLEELKKEVMSDFDNMIKKVSTVDKGVYVQASTLGSLEALLDFLTQSKIPVSSINIGPVNKKDVTKASVMKEHAPEYAVILAFDVKVSKEAREAAEDLGVTIFEAEIIYHLFDKFTKYMEDLTKKKQEESAPEAVWPCRLKIFPEYIFNKRDPIVLGVEVVEGTLRVGTPICVPTKEFIYLGRVTSVEINHKAVTEAKKGSSVAMKIEQPDVSAQQYMYARHFDASDELVSRISRQSIDVLKTNFKSQVTKEDVVLLAKLKTVFSIQ